MIKNAFILSYLVTLLFITNICYADGTDKDRFKVYKKMGTSVAKNGFTIIIGYTGKYILDNYFKTTERNFQLDYCNVNKDICVIKERFYRQSANELKRKNEELSALNNTLKERKNFWKKNYMDSYNSLLQQNKSLEKELFDIKNNKFNKYNNNKEK